MSWHFSQALVGSENRVSRIKALGNGQVPAVVKLAWEILRGEKNTKR